MKKKEAIEYMEIKNISPFETTTPERNKIRGWMSRSRGRTLGSLVITHINDNERDSPQFVRAFPKIHYMDDSDNVDGYFPFIHILEKRDGTCVQFYSLFDENNEFLEVVPKTREMPVMAEDFQEKINSLSITEKFVELARIAGDTTICGELFGVGNIHEIPYDIWEQEMTIEGIGMFDSMGAWSFESMYLSFSEMGIPIPFRHVNINKDDDTYNVFTTNKFNEWYSKWIDGEWSYSSCSLNDIYYKLQDELYEDIIKEANKRCVIEGSVWHISGISDNRFMKNKAYSVRQDHIQRAGVIPKPAIRHAVLKAREEFNKDDFDVFSSILPYINSNLEEEFDEFKVRKSENRVRSVWNNVIKSRITSKNIQEYVNKVNEAVGEDATIEDKMRKFAELYPEKKSISGKVYSGFLGDN